MDLGLAYIQLNEKTNDYLKDLGVTSIYNSLRWCNIQPSDRDKFVWNSYDAEFDLEKKYGLTSVRSISHTPTWACSAKDFPHWVYPPNLEAWECFIKELVIRYPGRTWTIWAEPDNYPPREADHLICFTGTAEEYNEMLKCAYRTAKKNDPNCVIGIGGLVGGTLNGSFPYKIFNGHNEDRLVFLEKLNVSFCDFVGADVYAFGYGGSQNIKNGLSRIRKITRRKPIWIMETGCKLTRTDKIDREVYRQEYGHETVTQETAAGLLLSIYKIMEDLDIQKMFWVTLEDSDWGLVNRLGRKHLTYHMFRLLNRGAI